MRHTDPREPFDHVKHTTPSGQNSAKSSPKETTIALAMSARGRAELSGGTSESSSDTNKNIRAQRYNAHHALGHGAHAQNATVPGGNWKREH